MSGTLIATRAAAKRALRQCRAIGQPNLVPLFRAAMAGRLTVLLADQVGDPVPLADLDALERPVLVIVTDREPGTGPDRWPGSAGLLAWCASFYAIEGGGPRELYQILAEETVKHRRFVFVETLPQFVNAWRVAAGGKPVGLATV